MSSKHSRYRHSRKRFNSLIWIPAIACVLVIGFMVALIYFSPKGVTKKSVDEDADYYYGKEVEDLDALIYFKEFEKKYKKNTVEARDYDTLSGHLLDLEKFILQNADLKHLVDLEYAKFKTYHDDYFAKEISLEVESLIQSAAELERSGKLEQSFQYMKKAWDLQDDIHEQYSLSQFVNFNRLSNLEVEATRLESKPFYVTLENAEVEAQKLIKEERFLEALEQIMKAKEMQEYINRHHRNSIYVDTQRLLSLSTEAQRIQSGTLYQRVNQLIEQSDELLEVGESEEAATLINDAKKIQEEIHEKYPQSPYVNAEFLLDLEKRRQTALGAKSLKELEREFVILNKLLRSDEVTTALSFARDFEDQLIAYEMNFPRSLNSLEEFRTQVATINLLSEELLEIHSLVDQGLVKIVAYDEVFLFKTEVPQSLYELVMKSNPSRQVGANYPVQAITFQEAITFCERLSHVLGEEVRLPEKEECLEWYLLNREEKLDNQAWVAQNSSGKVREVGLKLSNQFGLYDVAGNVGEWIGNELSSESQAFYLDSNVTSEIEINSPNQISTSSPHERSRWRGFRFVVIKTLF